MREATSYKNYDACLKRQSETPRSTGESIEEANSVAARRPLETVGKDNPQRKSVRISIPVPAKNAFEVSLK